MTLTPDEAAVERVARALEPSAFEPMYRNAEWARVKREDATKKARDVLAALASAAPAPGDAWRPIESAPKGEDVLVWWPIVKLDDNDEATDVELGGQRIISQCDDSGKYWQEPEVLNAIGAWFGDDGEYRHAPTHWQHLPAPPASRRAQGAGA